ncbi:MAG: Ni/Fe hydrogenase subunit alpha [Planctomycetes bacterium]|nr:Ni/Fe hydrogenase subunit alpha [Planctomycetota bacterium]
MSEDQKKTRTIRVDALARVEGEGAFTIRLKDGQVEGVELRIYEPPRFFEAFLRGRMAVEAPDLTARICGICPVAYQMSSVHAVEKIFGVTLPPPLRALRRLLYCGEWIESHVLHVFMLHAPDFLGYSDAISMARANPALAEIVKKSLRLKKAGNRIVEVLGGRAVHPINVRVGGFYRLPTAEELAPVREELAWARDRAREFVQWAAGLAFPDFTEDYEFVALRHADEYPMNEGRLVSSRGLDIPQETFLESFEEYQVPHSNALQSRRRNANDDGFYLVGPLARWNLNRDRVGSVVEDAAAAINLEHPVKNPHRSIVVRCLEVLYAFEEASRLLDSYRAPPEPSIDFQPRAGVGRAITEAPRGILFQEYETDRDGRIVRCTIVPPTSQNQGQIERDLLKLAPSLLTLSDAEAALQAERAIRNYDPCISCATHFLKLTVVGK